MKKTTLYGASAICLLFTACSADKLSEPKSPSVPLDRDHTFYVNMAIHADNLGTRASEDNGQPDAGATGDFADGLESANENGINNAYFVFYDEDGQVVGDIVPIEGLGTANSETSIDGETVDKWYSSTIPVVVRKGEKTPAQVICYINPISPSTLQNPLSVIQTIARATTYTNVGGKNYFAMSNSVFYPKDPENSGETSSEPQIAVAIPEDGLFDSEDEAKAQFTNGISSDKVVKIYVERYAAKLTFSTVGADPYQTATRIYDDEGNYTVANVSLQFNSKRWAVNAESNRSYVIKSFREENALGQIMADNYSYTTLDDRINALSPSDYTPDEDTNIKINGTLSQVNRWNWNNPTYNRSYWAISPAYFQDVYPEVASDVDTEDNQTYILPSELFGANPSKGFAVPESGSDTRYFKETTVGTKALASVNPAAAMPSVILVGQYDVTIGTGAAVTSPSFYTYLNGSVTVEGKTEQRPYVYFDDITNASTPLTSAVAGGGSMLRRFIAQSTILYVGEGEQKTRLTIPEAIKRINDPNYNLGLAVAEPTPEVRLKAGDDGEELKLQGNARTLQITSVADAKDLYIATANGYMQIVADPTEGTTIDNNTQIGITEANAILMQQVGYAYYYKDSKGYFNMPIKHLGWYRAGNDQKNDNKIDWSKVRVGDFGLVRNHSYTINVSEIKGLASGIGGDNTPIVPPASTTESYIAYSVRILKWAVVPEQTVKL